MIRAAGNVFREIAQGILDGRTESTEHVDDLTRLEHQYAGREAEFCAMELGMKMWAFPRHFCHAVRDHRMVSVRSSRKSSKTYTVSGLIPALSFAMPSVIVSTSASDRQVKDVLWSKVRTHVLGAKTELPCQLNQAELRITPDRFALGFSTNSEGRFRGFHAEPDVPENPDEGLGSDVHDDVAPLDLTPEEIAEHIERIAHEHAKRSNANRLVYIFDEAQHVPQIIFDAARGSWSSDRVHVIMCGNPFLSADEPHEFARSHQIGSRFHSIKIGTWEDPDFPDPLDDAADKKFTTGYGPDADRGCPTWLVPLDWPPAQKEEVAPTNPALYESDALGQFSEGDIGGRVFPPEVLRLAQERDIAKLALIGNHIGIDTSWEGDDRNVMLLFSDGVLVGSSTWGGQRTLETATRIARTWESWDKQLGGDGSGTKIPAENLHIDRAPVAAGVIEWLEDHDIPLDPVDFGGTPTNRWRHLVGGRIKFKNRRAELHWVLRELFRTQGAHLPSSEATSLILDEARYPNYDFSTSFELVIEPKDKIKERLGRSPDFLDAAMLAFARPDMEMAVGRL